MLELRRLENRRALIEKWNGCRRSNRPQTAAGSR